jgi:hypothetical protein
MAHATRTTNNKQRASSFYANPDKAQTICATQNAKAEQMKLTTRYEVFEGEPSDPKESIKA